MSAFLAWVVLTGVAIILAIGAVYIWKWGPGTITRRVQCPERHVSATVTFVQKEGAFGRVVVADVMHCSLLGDAPVVCGKACR